MTKSVGEHWACAELARSGWAPALTRDGIKRTDILAVATHLADRPTIEVQVKTATDAGRGTTFLPGDPTGKHAANDREWFVFVRLPRDCSHALHGYVVPRDHAMAVTWIVHQNWLTSPDARPGSRNTDIGRSRIEPVVFEGYRDRWDLLDLPTSDVPVMLPTWVRDRATEERVGLPPAHPWAQGFPAWLETDNFLSK